MTEDFISQRSGALCRQEVNGNPNSSSSSQSSRGRKFVHVVAVEKCNRAGTGRAAFREGWRHYRLLDKEPERRTVGSCEADALTSARVPAIERKNEGSRPEASKKERRRLRALERDMHSRRESDLSLDARQRRTLFRSWHRGMREMDLILGRFADAEIASLGNSELEDYELLLEAQDRDVFSWLTGVAEIPSLYDTPVLRKIRAFHSPTGPFHT